MLTDPGFIEEQHGDVQAIATDQQRIRIHVHQFNGRKCDRLRKVLEFRLEFLAQVAIPARQQPQFGQAIGAEATRLWP